MLIALLQFIKRFECQCYSNYKSQRVNAYIPKKTHNIHCDLLFHLILQSCSSFTCL